MIKLSGELCSFFKVILIFIVIILSKNSYSSGKDSTTSAFNTSQVTISGQWFLSYMNGKVDAENVNLITVTRGYINVNLRLNDSFSGRITPDISVDQEGDGAGDLEMRLKYTYLKWHLPDVWILSKPFFEIGLVHLPWINFEESINNYRVQGPMFLPRNGIISSADFGITLITLLGGEMDEAYKKKVNKSYPGRYGSIALGVYNGGGYHAFETNTNKPVQGRLSLRPFPDSIPGLQLSYHGVYGKGNTVAAPDWTINTGFVSYEDEYIVATGSYYNGVGNFTGSAVDSMGKALDQYGYSGYAELKLPSSRLSLMSRYDYFVQEEYGQKVKRNRYIIGIAYRFYSASKFLLDYDHNKGRNFFGEETSRIEAVVEVRF